MRMWTGTPGFTPALSSRAASRERSGVPGSGLPARCSALLSARSQLMMARSISCRPCGVSRKYAPPTSATRKTEMRRRRNIADHEPMKGARGWSIAPNRERSGVPRRSAPLLLLGLLGGLDGRGRRPQRHRAIIGIDRAETQTHDAAERLCERCLRHGRLRALLRRLERHHGQLLIARARTAGVGILAVGERRIDHIAVAAHGKGGRQTRGLEVVVAFLQVGPELVPIVFAVCRQIGRSRAEGKRMQLEVFLTAGERL